MSSRKTDLNFIFTKKYQKNFTITKTNKEKNMKKTFHPSKPSYLKSSSILSLLTEANDDYRTKQSSTHQHTSSTSVNKLFSHKENTKTILSKNNKTGNLLNKYENHLLTNYKNNARALSNFNQNENKENLNNINNPSKKIIIVKKNKKSDSTLHCLTDRDMEENSTTLNNQNIENKLTDNNILKPKSRFTFNEFKNNISNLIRDSGTPTNNESSNLKYDITNFRNSAKNILNFNNFENINKFQIAFSTKNLTNKKIIIPHSNNSNNNINQYNINNNSPYLRPNKNGSFSGNKKILMNFNSFEKNRDSSPINVKIPKYKHSKVNSACYSNNFFQKNLLAKTNINKKKSIISALKLQKNKKSFQSNQSKLLDYVNFRQSLNHTINSCLIDNSGKSLNRTNYCNNNYSQNYSNTINNNTINNNTINNTNTINTNCNTTKNKNHFHTMNNSAVSITSNNNKKNNTINKKNKKLYSKPKIPRIKPKNPIDKIQKKIPHKKKMSASFIDIPKLTTNPKNSNTIFSLNSSMSPITKDSSTIMNNNIIINKKIIKIDSCSMAGYSAPGISKINQDNYFIVKEFLKDPEQFFMGVCDGHGSYGHLISEYICNNLEKYIKNNTINEISKAFFLTQKNLIENSKIDCTLSGSTCNSLLISTDKIICANLGDCRAVLARYENGQYNAINLSRDHKPTESDEMKRILLKNGIIKQIYDKNLKNYIGPERIWIKNSEIPGLHISRSFGDNLAHGVGVISEPEIKKVEFNGSEKFILLASDGIWKFIDSDESVEMIKDFYENDMDAIGALNCLVKEAFKRWKDERNVIDDITAILIFFD